jgi:AbrB family looped-hinge helix DNA binding protein
MTYHAKIYGGGKMAIPADVRKALGIKDGDRVTLDIEDGRLTVKTQAQLIKDFKSFVPEGVSLVDELIAERRAEAAREQA